MCKVCLPNLVNLCLEQVIIYLMRLFSEYFKVLIVMRHKICFFILFLFFHSDVFSQSPAPGCPTADAGDSTADGTFRTRELNTKSDPDSIATLGSAKLCCANC